MPYHNDALDAIRFAMALPSYAIDAGALPKDKQRLLAEIDAAIEEQFSERYGILTNAAKTKTYREVLDRGYF